MFYLFLSAFLAGSVKSCQKYKAFLYYYKCPRITSQRFWPSYSPFVLFVCLSFDMLFHPFTDQIRNLVTVVLHHQYTVNHEYWFIF